MTDTHRFTGTHLEYLADGRPVEPGDTVKLDTTALADNQHLVDDGTLVELAQPAKKTSDKKVGD